MLETYEKLLKQVDNRARFLAGVLSGDIQCINRKKNELRQEFIEKGFDPLPKEGQPVVIRPTGVKEDASDYDYLTKMSVSSLTEEYLEHLLVLKKRLEIKVGLLRKAAAEYLKSEKEPRLLDTNYTKAPSDRDNMAAKDSQVFEAAPRRQYKRTASHSLEESAMLMDGDENEALELKDQSQEHTGKHKYNAAIVKVQIFNGKITCAYIETEWSQKQERKKQRKGPKKQRKESSETGTPIHCCPALDFRGHDKSGDGFLVEEIKRISSGLDGIEITHCRSKYGSSRVG
ncbi:DNA topoisomerase 2-like isoform X1 [Lolium rigidum]|uniref:DNA topoisomerase 2-like isoform X1 n=1 Tax=Lolium rigidum TaxID=89674 RepID=UPI001F5DDCE7|nr:DNA topoisomerase 2-like isoform X1 [Lolium rigidum]